MRTTQERLALSYPLRNFNADFNDALPPRVLKSKRAAERVEEIETIARVTESQCRTWQWLKNFTALRLGGPIAAIIYPATIMGAAQVVHRLQQAGIRWRALGQGTSVLAADDLPDFVAISLRLLDERLVFESERVQVPAGYSLMALVRAAADRGLSGLENFAGLTGSLGGALCLETASNGRDLWHLIDSVTVAERGKTRIIPLRDLVYREIVYREGPRSLAEDRLILSATLRLAPGDAGTIKEATEKWELARWETAPDLNVSASRVFTEIASDDEAGKYGTEPALAAGEVVDQPGFKGRAHGGARVSEANAEYLVNDGDATADEVMSLSALIREQARKLRGLNLKFGADVWKNDPGNETDRQ